MVSPCARDQERAANRARLLFLCRDSDQVNRFALLIGHLQLPFLARLEFAIDVLEQLSCNEGRFAPGGAGVWQFFALGVVSPALVIDIEKVSRHGDKMQSRKYGSGHHCLDKAGSGRLEKRPRLEAEAFLGTMQSVDLLAASSAASTSSATAGCVLHVVGIGAAAGCRRSFAVTGLIPHA